MERLRSIERGEDIVGYASSLAETLFKGITRDTGLPYTQQHLNQVALRLEDVTLPSDYQPSAIAAAWLHDAIEDTKLEVFDPYDSDFTRHEELTYLNDLLKEADEECFPTCFMVHLMTHRNGVLYLDYVKNIFTFPDESYIRDYHILTGCLKMVDRRMNINPDESRNVNDLVKEYFMIPKGDDKALEEFYRRTRTIDAFRKKGVFDLDIGLFVQTLRDAFMEKQRAAAVDNLSQYLPLAERKLLIEVRENNELFHYKKLRNLLKETYIDSFKLYPGSVHEVNRLGINKKAPEVPGYESLLKEIRKEIAEGHLKIEKP
jgi:hypothetical protein